MGSVAVRVSSSMLTRFDAGANNSLRAKRLSRLETMQSLDQHKACSVGSHQDRGLLALVEHARSDFVYTRLFESLTPFDRYVDVRDRKGFALQHTWDRGQHGPKQCVPAVLPIMSLARRRPRGNYRVAARHHRQPVERSPLSQRLRGSANRTWCREEAPP